MKAMILSATAPLSENRQPLQLVELDTPEPGEGQVLIKVSVCGVCHTELDEIEGRTAPPSLASASALAGFTRRPERLTRI